MQIYAAYKSSFHINYTYLYDNLDAEDKEVLEASVPYDSRREKFQLLV